MNVVGKVSSLISQGVFSVATPFHPFGGAVDIIVVEQDDGTYKSTPWYARFGKFQGVLKGTEKIVRIEVNGVEANFNMFLDNSGEAYFVREVDPKDGFEGFKKELDILEVVREDSNDGCSNADSCSQENDMLKLGDTDFSCDDVEVRDERVTLGMDRLDRVDSDCDRIFYEFNDEKSSLEDSLEFPDCGGSGSTYDDLDSVKHALESQNSNSEVILVSIDGHILTAPLSSSGRVDDVEPSGQELDLGSGEGSEKNNTVKVTSAGYCLNEPEVTTENFCRESIETPSSEHLEPGEGESDGEHMYYRLDSMVSDDQEKDGGNDVFRSCLDISKLVEQSPTDDQENVESSAHTPETSEDSKVNSHLSSPTDKTEEDNLEILRGNDKSSPHDSENLFGVSLPKVEVATHQRNTSDMDYDDFGNMCDQSVSRDKELLQQVEENPAAKIIHSNEVSDKNGESENVGPANGNSDNKFEKAGNENSERDYSRLENGAPVIDFDSEVFTRLEISICGHLLYAGMGSNAAREAFDGNRLLIEDFKLAAKSLVKNEDLVVRIQGQYVPWSKAEHTILAMQAGNLDVAIEPNDAIPVEEETKPKSENPSPSRGWSLWSSIPFRRLRTQENDLNNSSSAELLVDNDSGSMSGHSAPTPTARAFTDSPRKQIIRTNVPTTEEIGSLNLKEGQNMVNFIFSTRVLGSQKVEAHIFLWKWNTRIVISDVDGTITKSDVLGQVMPLVGKDWTHCGIARLFSAIKENGYQLLFLSARAIVQSNITKTFLFNLKQDGKSLPVGPVVISPDGLFPSLYREVIRRAPHEFKIACLEDIKALFPIDHNPFYAGFGNRDTDELSYRKIGIPKGKIFIINPKGEVAINHRIDVKSYTSLHTLVHDMFPPTPMLEEEDYNSWNYWKVPLPGVD